MTENVDAGKRRTLHIGRRVTQSVFRAFDYADALGRPLNVYAVIHLNETDAACATTLFERIRHKFRDWLLNRYKRSGKVPVRPAYAYAMENPSDALPHVNWALYIPPEFMDEFLEKLPKWIEKVQGALAPFTLDVQEIETKRAKRLAKYIVKGTEPAFITHFFLEDLYNEHGSQGEVWGKRAGVSPALGPTERKATGFRPVRRRFQSKATSPEPASWSYANTL